MMGLRESDEGDLERPDSDAVFERFPEDAAIPHGAGFGEGVCFQLAPHAPSS
jgi:hypothetical protein